MKTVSILGSTGSIGRQALQVCENLGYAVVGLAAGSDIDALERQAQKYSPRFIAVAEAKKADELRLRLRGSGISVLGGNEGVLKVAGADCDIVLNAITGIAGLKPSLTAIGAGNTLALANKETLVAGGRKVMEYAAEKGVKIIPVDSEHSAIFQCIQARGDVGRISKLILTASGGPFFGRKRGELAAVKPEDALCHPTWNMGKKVTIDSATMVNKGLEVMEAALLFGVSESMIDVVVHRQSIVHSLVEFIDGSVLAQLGVPDMRTPIQYALTWPERKPGLAKHLSLAEAGSLDFAAPDDDAFPAVNAARRAFREGGTVPAVFNAADEVAVAAFLEGRIGFCDITETIEKTLPVGCGGDDYDFDDVFEADMEARAFAGKLIDRR